MVTPVATVRGRLRHQLLELQWLKLPNQALDWTANSVGPDGSKCRDAGQLLALASGLENQSRNVSKGIPAASPISMIPVVSRRTRK